MDSLQEAHIHPPNPYEAHFIMDPRALFDYFWTVEQKHPPTPILTLGRARVIFNMTDWIRLKEESNLHLGCF